MTFEIERRTADFIRTLDPLFAERPVYPILLTDEVPAYYHPAEGCEGWTSAFADLLARPLLEEQGRWAGRGFTFFMLPPPNLDATDRTWLGKCVHEAGHYATFNEVRCKFILDRMPPEIQNAFAPYATPSGFVTRLEQSGESVCQQNITDTELERNQHGADWIRATLHMVERGYIEALPFAACNTSQYGRVPYWMFQIALADELRELADVPIREILKTEPPAKFLEYMERPPFPPVTLEPAPESSAACGTPAPPPADSR